MVTNKKVQQTVVLNLDDVIEIAKRLDKELMVLNYLNGGNLYQ